MKILLKKLTVVVNRGRKDLKGPCVVCGSNANIEIHHVRSLKKRPKKGDFLSDMMSKMNRKQVPLCKSCHLMYILVYMTENRLDQQVKSGSESHMR
jgi:hypothetical protein